MAFLDGRARRELHDRSGVASMETLSACPSNRLTGTSSTVEWRDACGRRH
jgi:hypothetical protein